jgi:hypothetical protein
LLALVIGVTASASSAGYEDTQPGSAPSIAARIADLDDVAPIVVGGLVMAALHAGSVLEAAGQVAVTTGVGLGVGIVGTLLIEQADSDAERGLFLIGALALAGGAATYLGLSPLLSGLAAGVVWNLAPGRVDAIVRRDVRRYQHPLVVLVLLVAGASIRPSIEAAWLLVPFVLFRVSGKLAGGWLAARLAPSIAPADLGAHLLAPGVIGLAFAIGAVKALGPDGTAVLTAVTVGTLVSEIVALAVAPSASPRGSEGPA